MSVPAPASASPSSSRPRPWAPWAWLGLGLIVAALDLASKAWAARRLAGRPPLELLSRALRLELEVNPGAAFGLWTGGDARMVPVLLSLALLIYLGWLARHLPRSGWAGPTGLGLMFGGAVGNLVDRARAPLDPHGPWGPTRTGVTDFIVVEPWRGWAWPAFNLADVALVSGAGLLLLTLWRLRGRAAEA